MILKSFFKKKSTKICLMITTILISIIILLLSFIGYFNSIVDKIYSDRTLLIAMSKNDSINLLKKYNHISNINKELVFKLNFDYDTIIKSSYLTKDENGNVLDSYQDNNIDLNGRISWDDLIIFNFDTYILVKKDNENKLLDDEIKIGINEMNYSYHNKHEYVVNHPLGFYFQNEAIEFNVKDVYISQRPEVTISSNLYSKLLKQQKIYVYTAKENSYHQASKLKEKLKKEKINVIHDTLYFQDESTIVSHNSDLIDILNLAMYITIILFFIITIIILKNIIEDINYNIDLEKKLGFNKIRIKFNIFERLLILNVLSYILAFSISLLFIKGINKIFKISLIIPKLNILFILFIIVLGLNIMLSLLKK